MALAGLCLADVYNAASWQAGLPLTKAEVRRCLLGPLQGLVVEAEGCECTQAVCGQQVCFPAQGRTPWSLTSEMQAGLGITTGPLLYLSLVLP